MTWKELKDKISLMTEEEQRQEVAVWGENMNLMKDCSLEKTDEDMYYNSEWDYTCEESELEPEDKNDPDVHEVCMCFYLLSVMAYFYIVIIINCHRIGYKRE